jgi:hypothetical protein
MKFSLLKLAGHPPHLNYPAAYLGFAFHSGKDATEAFEDVGHSDEARGFLPGMLVGEFEKTGVSDHPTPGPRCIHLTFFLVS